MTLTATFTLALLGDAPPAGIEYGPGSVTGQRMVVEQMGAPAGSLNDLFASFSGDTGGSQPTETAE